MIEILYAIQGAISDFLRRTICKYDGHDWRYSNFQGYHTTRECVVCARFETPRDSVDFFYMVVDQIERDERRAEEEARAETGGVH